MEFFSRVAVSGFALLLAGCGTTSIKDIEKAEASLKFAEGELAKVDYAKLLSRRKLIK